MYFMHQYGGYILIKQKIIIIDSFYLPNVFLLSRTMAKKNAPPLIFSFSPGSSEALQALQLPWEMKPLTNCSNVFSL